MITKIYRILASLVPIIGIIIMYKTGITGDYGLNFFSYFTIQSNLIASFSLFVSGLDKKIDFIRGATVVYMLTTAIVFMVLFEKGQIYHNNYEILGDMLTHKITPLLVLLDLILNPFSHAISWKKSLAWISFPLIWLTYTFVRGALTGWYPYFFINPNLEPGWTGVIKYCLGITVAILALCILVSKIGSRKKHT